MDFPVSVASFFCELVSVPDWSGTLVVGSDSIAFCSANETETTAIIRTNAAEIIFIDCAFPCNLGTFQCQVFYFGGTSSLSPDCTDGSVTNYTTRIVQGAGNCKDFVRQDFVRQLRIKKEELRMRNDQVRSGECGVRNVYFN